MFNAHVETLIRFQLCSLQDEIDYSWEHGGLLSDEELIAKIDERTALLDSLVAETGDKDAAFDWMYFQA